MVGIDDNMAFRAYMGHGATKAILDAIFVLGCEPILGQA